MKRILIIILLAVISFATSVSASSLTENERICDSLTKLIPTLEKGTSRLWALKQLVFYSQRSEEFMGYSNQLLHEAKELKDYTYTFSALSFQVIHFYNKYELDSVNVRIPILDEYCKQLDDIEYWDQYFELLKYQINLSVAKGYYELGINLGLEMEREAKAHNSIVGRINAYQTISYAYLNTNRLKQSKEYIMLAYNLLSEANNPVMSNYVLYFVVSLNTATKDYETLKKYIDEKYAILTDPNNASIFGARFIQTNIFDLYLDYSNYYAYTKQPDKSLEYLKIATKQFSSDSSINRNRSTYYAAYSVYYASINEYEKALSYQDTAMRILRNRGDMDFIPAIATQAEYLYMLGRYNESIPLYKQVNYLTDSLERAKYINQMDLIKGDYDKDITVLERQKLIARIQWVLLGMTILAIISAILFWLRIVKIRKTLKISEQKTREATQQAAEATDAKNRFLSNMSDNVRKPLTTVVELSQKVATETELSEEKRSEYVKIIQNNTTSLIKLVNDILDLSRLEAKMVKFQISPYTVNALCYDIVFRHGMQDNHPIKLDYQTQALDGTAITTDSTRMSQVINSLILYPQSCKLERNVKLEITEENGNVVFRVLNSPLADLAFQSQDVIIRHEINRLFAENFKATYQIIHESDLGPQIVITYPICEEIK